MPQENATPAHEPPATPTETLIAALFGELLGVTHVGRHDNFFELGGHSLMVMRFVNRLFQSLGVRLSVRALFTMPTVARIAEIVEEEMLSQIDQLSDEDIERELHEADPA